MFYPFGAEWKEITVGDAFTDDGRPWNYAYTQKGFFQLLDMANQPTHYGNAYTTEEGNPIELWRMPIIESDVEVGYSGISFEELDFMFLSRFADHILRPRYVKSCIGVPPDLGPVEPRKDASDKCVIPIVRMYRNKWVKLWESMFYDYNPIENYNMVEEALKDKTSLTHGKKTKMAGTEQTETDLTSQIKAYDASATWKDSDKQTGSNTLTYGAGQNERYNQDSGTDVSDHEYKFTRKGNVGVTTSQQMITQERKLLMFDYFNEVVFPDIDNIIAMSVY